MKKQLENDDSLEFLPLFKPFLIKNTIVRKAIKQFFMQIINDNIMHIIRYTVYRYYQTLSISDSARNE